MPRSGKREYAFPREINKTENTRRPKGIELKLSTVGVIINQLMEKHLSAI